MDLRTIVGLCGLAEELGGPPPAPTRVVFNRVDDFYELSIEWPGGCGSIKQGSAPAG